MKATKELSWSNITGEITYTTLIESKQRNALSPRYGILVLYKYSIDGVGYYGFLDRGGLKFGSESWAKTELQKHPEGTAINVFYDSNDMVRDPAMFESLKYGLYKEFIPQEYNELLLGNSTITPGSNPLGSLPGIIVTWIIFIVFSILILL